MTLGLAWVRTLGNTRELVVASDSRLSGGKFWDANPKIMLTPRSDCVLSFAGDTADAYPLMLQAYNAIKSHARLSSREIDITTLKGHLVRVFNRSREFMSNFPAGEGRPDGDATFVLSGYSWRRREFCIWRLHFDRSINRYTFQPINPWPGQDGAEPRQVAFIGDVEPVKAAKEMLVERLRSSGKLRSGGLNMEPFEVLRDIVRAESFSSVGGPPQMVKIYEHMNVRVVPIFWPNRASEIATILGRPLMAYEKPSSTPLDPDEPLRTSKGLPGRSDSDSDNPA